MPEAHRRFRTQASARVMAAIPSPARAPSPVPLPFPDLEKLAERTVAAVVSRRSPGPGGTADRSLPDAVSVTNGRQPSPVTRTGSGVVNCANSVRIKIDPLCAVVG